MDKCVKCGQPTHTIYSSIGYLCGECRDRLRKEQLIEKSKDVHKASDFKEWRGADMSELFWMHLGIYVKEPTPESFQYMSMAYRWACHADHGLSNSFYNALKWANIDLYEEDRRWRKATKE